MSAHPVEGFETWVDAEPSFYMIRPEPSRNYGVGNVKLYFYLKGPHGVVQWLIGTEWGIEKVRAHLASFGHKTEYRKPEGLDLGYHSPKPHYEGHEPMSEHCEVLGGRCYYDGSGLNADLLIEGFLAGGTAWLWPKLREVYAHYFEDGPWPDFTPQYQQHPDDKAKLQ